MPPAIFFFPAQKLRIDVRFIYLSKAAWDMVLKCSIILPVFYSPDITMLGYIIVLVVPSTPRWIAQAI